MQPLVLASLSHSPIANITLLSVICVGWEQKNLFIYEECKSNINGISYWY